MTEQLPHFRVWLSLCKCSGWNHIHRITFYERNAC